MIYQSAFRIEMAPFLQFTAISTASSQVHRDQFYRGPPMTADGQVEPRADGRVPSGGPAGRRYVHDGGLKTAFEAIIGDMVNRCSSPAVRCA